MDLGQDRWPYLIGGGFGALFYAVVKLGLTLFRGQSPTRREVMLALGNIGFGVVAGLVAAPVLGPPFASVIPQALVGLRDPQFVGFMVVVLAWEVAPICFDVAKRWVNNRVKEGGQ